jgi:hypothetical protein
LRKRQESIAPASPRPPRPKTQRSGFRPRAKKFPS